jgi:hypothetical protein
MSACDGSLLYINNMTLEPITVSSFATYDGTSLRGISVDQQIDVGEALQCTVFSEGGSDGTASGNIVIKAAGTSFTLNYLFKPKDDSGSAPCTPSVPSSASSQPQSTDAVVVTWHTTKGDQLGAVLNFYFKLEEETV